MHLPKPDPCCPRLGWSIVLGMTTSAKTSISWKMQIAHPRTLLPLPLPLVVLSVLARRRTCQLEALSWNDNLRADHDHLLENANRITTTTTTTTTAEPPTSSSSTTTRTTRTTTTTEPPPPPLPPPLNHHHHTMNYIMFVSIC